MPDAGSRDEFASRTFRCATPPASTEPARGMKLCVAAEPVIRHRGGNRALQKRIQTETRSRAFPNPNIADAGELAPEQGEDRSSDSCRRFSIIPGDEKRDSGFFLKSGLKSRTDCGYHDFPHRASIIRIRPRIASSWSPVREVNTTAAKSLSGSTQIVCPVKPVWKIVCSERPLGR